VGDEAQEELIIPGQTTATGAPEKETDMDTAPVDDGVE